MTILKSSGIAISSSNEVGGVGHEVLVVDEGEVAEVEGHEVGVLRRGRQEAREIDAVRGEEAGGAGFAGDRGIEAEDDVGLGRIALELDAAQRADRAVGGDELDDAAAGLLEAGLELRAGTPLGGEAVVGVDAQDRHFLGGRGSGDSRGPASAAAEELEHGSFLSDAAMSLGDVKWCGRDCPCHLELPPPA